MHTHMCMYIYIYTCRHYYYYYYKFMCVIISMSFMFRARHCVCVYLALRLELVVDCLELVVAASTRHCVCDCISLFTLLDLCVSSLRRGHANLLCIVPILTDDPRRESTASVIVITLLLGTASGACRIS